MRARRSSWALKRRSITGRDFVEAALSLTDGKGVAVVLDMVGGDYVPRNLAALAVEGRHVSIAHQGGAKAEISIPQLMSAG